MFFFSLFSKRINRFFFMRVMFIEQTTLLNHILTGGHGKRIAVIENEVIVLVSGSF